MQPSRPAEAQNVEYFDLLMHSLGPADPENTLESRQWLIETLQIAVDAGVVQSALRALCIIRVAAASGEQSLFRLGRSIYGQALLALQKDLLSKDKAFTLQTVSACRIMGLYESTYCAVGRRDISLSHDEWKPASHCARYLVELLSFYGIRLGALFARMDRAVDSSKSPAIPSTSAAQNVLREMLRLEEQLIGCTDLPLYWADPATAEDDISDVCGFSFRSNDVGQQLITYWTFRLMLSVNLNDVCLRIMNICASQQSDLQGILIENAFPSWLMERVVASHTDKQRITFANDVIKAAAYTTQGRLGVETMSSSAFPLAMAMAELSKYNRKQTEFRRGVRYFARVQSHMQGAKQWMAGREYLAGEDGDTTSASRFFDQSPHDASFFSQRSRILRSLASAVSFAEIDGGHD
ncbi:MAG: hypothetical protein Q9159_004470 [Coniocarpon cinnabarinum]